MNKLLNLKGFGILLLILASILGAKSLILISKLYPELFYNIKDKLIFTSASETEPITGQKPISVDIMSNIAIGEHSLNGGRGLSEEQLISDLNLQLQKQFTKQKALDLREQTITAIEVRVAQKLEELTKLKEEVKHQVQEYKNIHEEKIKSLVNMYENMPPKKAAEILDILDMEVVLVILGKMKAFKAAPILANMPPAKVSEISRQYTTKERYN